MPIEFDVSGGAGGETGGLAETDRHRLLASDRRRVALDVLAEHQLPIGLEKLAEKVAARESDRGEVDESVVEQVMITFHHQHLPLMSQMGLIDYDPDSKHVEIRWTDFALLMR